MLESELVVSILVLMSFAVQKELLLVLHCIKISKIRSCNAIVKENILPKFKNVAEINLH